MIPHRVLPGLLFLMLTYSALGQSSIRKKLEIMGAKTLFTDTTSAGKKVQVLKGNVKLKQDSVFLTGDQVLFYIETNAADVYGNVHIWKGDSLDIYSDSLFYNGETGVAVLKNNVRLDQQGLQLRTDYLEYYKDQDYAVYYNGGHVTGDNLDLKSKIGYYYNRTKRAYFKDSVVVKGDQYDLTSDTLEYDTETKTSYFHGPTDIHIGDSDIYCESGWYSETTGKSRFGKNTVLTDGPQTLHSDSLDYDSNTEYGESYKAFKWIDTTQNIVLTGEEAQFWKQEERVIATKKPMLIYGIDKDSLYLTADTLKALVDSNNYREFYAFNRVKMYKSNLQGLADSLFFSYKDSVIRMYDDPVLWQENNQLTGDTIYITLKNNQLHRLDLKRKGFIANPAGNDFYNQIKGRNIFGFFKQGDLNSLTAIGNGQSVYFAVDDSNAYIGVNEAKCSDIVMGFKDHQVDRIRFEGGPPEAKFSPIQQIDPTALKLEGFQWHQEKRPLSKKDLLLPVPTP